MSVEAVRNSIERIRESTGSVSFAGERSEELVASAEEALGFSLPESYRLFVRSLGAGSVCAEEIFGVTSDDFVDSAVPNGVWLTLDARREWGLPSSMFVVYFDGGVDYYVLDCTMENPRLQVWRPGITSNGDELEVVADDFGSFLTGVVGQRTVRRS